MRIITNLTLAYQINKLYTAKLAHLYHYDPDEHEDRISMAKYGAVKVYIDKVVLLIYFM